MGFHNQTVNQISILLKNKGKKKKKKNRETIMSLTNHLPQSFQQYLQRQTELLRLRENYTQAAVCLSRVESLTKDTGNRFTTCWQLERWHAVLCPLSAAVEGRRSLYSKTFKNANLATQNSHKNRKQINSWTYE